jgi:hypothetical protein
MGYMRRQERSVQEAQETSDIRRRHKHGRHKMKIAREWTESFILKQIYFSVNKDNVIAGKYIELRSSAVRRFREVNSCLEMVK